MSRAIDETDDCDFIVYIILHIVYVEFFVMYICICIKLKRNYVGFDPQWMRYVGGRLKSGSSPKCFDKNVHWNLRGFEGFDDLKYTNVYVCILC